MNVNLRDKASSGDLLFLWTEKSKGITKKARTGEIRAKSIDHARFQLSRQGVKAVSLKKAKSHTGVKISLAVVASFVRQLAVMIQSGVPLGQSLGLISGGMTSKSKRNMQTVVRAIRADVESGLKLSDAMRKHPRCFDNLFCNTLAAGENAGELDTALDRLATHTEKTLRIRQKVRKAMVYPSIVVLVAVAVTVGMLLFVLPSFKSIYAQFEAELPLLTLALLAASDFLQNNGLMLLGVMALAVYSLIQSYRRSLKLRNSLDVLMLRIPLLGDLMRTAVHARWTRTFATLSASGVPITSALESVASVSQIRSFQDATLEVRQAVASGARVSDSMEAQKIFPAESVQMIRIGEESGRMDAMLERLANQYEINLDDKVDTLSTVMEPMIMCVIGVLVGVLIVGMYMPIFNMGGIV
ncbi:type II secretion system F family protein [Limnobacter parvus]|uniref:Type II secretion system F family protein n=1 Tax=Limnobacter parvus TaxID=2939690 RepID=A0ABT1XJ33_9BURK|nr:type II secretion system F family protein [Limnobacter parvus]MCR2746104.1 type II secretion system F family protein [Limnobacter parvus]